MIKIQKEDFNSDEEIHNIKKIHSNVGAVNSFIGYVRDNNNNENVQSINLSLVDGDDIFKISFNITGKWENSSDEEWLFMNPRLVH